MKWLETIHMTLFFFSSHLIVLELAPQKMSQTFHYVIVTQEYCDNKYYHKVLSVLKKNICLKLNGIK